MADASRFPQGIVINGVITTARPVGTIVRDTASGQLFISTNATVATYTLLAGGTATVIADPGTGVAIPVTQSGFCDLTVGTGAETNTMAIPTFLGQQISIVNGTNGGGTRTVTVAQAINQAGNTKMAFGAAADAITLTAFSIAGALRWRVTYNDGVALS